MPDYNKRRENARIGSRDGLIIQAAYIGSDEYLEEVFCSGDSSKHRALPHTFVGCSWSVWLFYLGREMYGV